MMDHRTALARAMRDERIGLTRFGWDRLDQEAQEDWRRRADHVGRLLAERGYTIAKTGASKPVMPVPAERTILSSQTVPDPSKVCCVRADGDKWSIVLVDRKTNEEVVEQSFTLDEAFILVGTVIARDPAGAKRLGLGRMLAATIEILRLNAASLAVSDG